MKLTHLIFWCAVVLILITLMFIFPNEIFIAFGSAISIFIVLKTPLHLVDGLELPKRKLPIVKTSDDWRVFVKDEYFGKYKEVYDSNNNPDDAVEYYQQLKKKYELEYKRNNPKFLK